MLGHPHGLSEKAWVIKDYASFKAQSEDRNNETPILRSLKDYDEKNTEDRNP